MITITIKLKSNKLLDTIISSSLESIHTALGMLESTPAVDSYKLTYPSIGVADENLIREYFSGYGQPHGKLCTKFYNK